MASASITLTVRVAWWVRPYIRAVALFSRMTGLTPDVEKVSRTARRGLRIVTSKG